MELTPEEETYLSKIQTSKPRMILDSGCFKDIDFDEELKHMSWEEQIKTLYSIARVKHFTQV